MKVSSHEYILCFEVHFGEGGGKLHSLWLSGLIENQRPTGKKKKSTSDFLQLFLPNELSLFSEAMTELKEKTALFGCIRPASILKKVIYFKWVSCIICR